MNKKNLLVALVVSIFWCIIVAIILNVKNSDDAEFDEFESEYEDSLMFDTNVDEQLDYDLQPNQILVSCDTVVKYWENINTEEQHTSLEITCDTIFLYCDTLTKVCDTLYYTNN